MHDTAHLPAPRLLAGRERLAGIAPEHPLRALSRALSRVRRRHVAAHAALLDLILRAPRHG